MTNLAPATREAWAELVGFLGDMVDEYLAPGRGVVHEIDVVDAFRNVTHQLGAAFEFVLEKDPERPRFTRFLSPERKVGKGDNPDAIYYSARIRGDRAYRIRGVRGDECYVSFTVHGVDPTGGASEPHLVDISDRDLEIASDGSYELILSPDERPGNWLRLPPDAASVVTRHYFLHDYPAAADPDVVVRVRIDPIEDPGPPEPVGDKAMAEGLRRVTAFVRDHTVGPPRQAPTPGEAPPNLGFLSRVVNELPEPFAFRGSNYSYWGAPDIVYALAPFRVGPDEALVVEGAMPACVFANLVLWTRQVQTFDYRNRRTSLNKDQLVLDDQGRYRIVIAHTDPGVPNWIDTAGHEHGLMGWRFLLPEGQPERSTCSVVPLAEVASLA